MQSILKEKEQQIIDALSQKKLVSPDNLRIAHVNAQKVNKDVISYLIEEKVVHPEEVVKISAQISGLPYVNLIDVGDLDPQTLELIPQEIAREYMAVPLGMQNNRIMIAMMYADDIQKVDYLSNLLGAELNVYMASEAGITNALHQYEIKIKEDDIMKAMGLEEEVKPKSRSSILTPFRSSESADIQVLTEESPASKTLQTILQYAIRHRASDIHIEALEHSVRIRVRIDGVLVVISTLPKALEASLIAKVKICAQLKVDEKRLPQDGEFVINIFGRTIDLRVAIAPTIHGEQVIMRILDRSGVALTLEEMGYCGRTLQVIRDSLKNSTGMVLTSGPTGSGKTTSLYTLLKDVAQDTVKVITLEDPPEYKMDGVNQIPVNKSIGLTFAEGLRSILRQDPDVIMVGEIRDRETASLAVQAALTGHLVFSTLHTNSAAGILPRLLDMGIEPFLIASTIRVVIGQRLVRKNTDDVKEYKSDPNQTLAIQKTLKNVLPSKEDSHDVVEKIHRDLGYHDLPLIEDKAYILSKGADADNDPQAGYKGRVGLYEAFPISEEIKRLIGQKASSDAIQQQAQKEGMITMRQDGYLKALDGMTTLSEIDRVIADNNV